MSHSFFLSAKNFVMFSYFFAIISIFARVFMLCKLKNLCIGVIKLPVMSNPLGDPP